MGSPTVAGFPALDTAPGASKSSPALGEGTLGLRVVVRTPNVDSFIQKYSRFVKDDRIFIFTKGSQPPGTRLRFTLALADGKVLLSGEGTVTRVRPDTGDSSRPPGMELRFAATDEDSKKMVAQLLGERHKQAAPASPAAPAPSPERPRIAATGPSPLLTRSLAGGPKGLPSRPGTLQKTMIGIGEQPKPEVPSEPTIPGDALLEPVTNAGAPEPPSPPPTPPEPRAIALARTLALPASEVLQAASSVPAPVSVLRPPAHLAAKPVAPPVVALASALEARADVAPAEETDVGTMPGETNVYAPPVDRTTPDSGPLRSVHDSGQVTMPGGDASATSRHAAFDPDGLFAGASASSVSADASDDLSHSFPGLAQAPAFAEGWRSTDAASLVPANPFSEVSDNAIEYFVEWSLERSTAAEAPVQATAFGAVQMRAPVATPEPDAAQTAATRRAATIRLGAAFAVGTLFGGLVVALLRSGGPAPVAVAKPSPPPPVAAAAPAVAPEPVAAAPAAPAAPAPAVAAARPARPSDRPAAAPAAAGDKVTLSSVPSGAVATIDGKERGKTPLALELPAGPHQLALKLDRYAAYSATFQAPGTVEAQLKRPSATLTITSTPSGAEVSIKGQKRGKTPLTLTVQAYEAYPVEVSLPGGKAWKKRVYAKGPSTSVNAVLVAPKAAPAVARPATPAAPVGRGIR